MGFESRLDEICDVLISDCLIEDISKRMPYIMKTLRHKRSPLKDYSDEELKKYIVDISQWDPTGDKFLDYIARQVRDRNIDLPNDGPRILGTLSIFNKIRSSGKLTNEWKHFQNGQHLDINRYKNWRDLERLAIEFAGDDTLKGSREQQKTLKKIAEEGSELVFSKSIATRSGKYNIEIYRLDTPAACVYYGFNTRWCTSSLYDPHASDKRAGKPVPPYAPYIELDKIRVPYIKRGQYEGYPSAAADYLASGPLYAIYINGDPYIQFTHDVKEFRNVQDKQMTRCSSPIDLVLGLWSHEIDDPNLIDGINRIRQTIKPEFKNYPNRPPMADPYKTQ